MDFADHSLLGGDGVIGVVDRGELSRFRPRWLFSADCQGEWYLRIWVALIRHPVVVVVESPPGDYHIVGAGSRYGLLLEGYGVGVIIRPGDLLGDGIVCAVDDDFPVDISVEPPGGVFDHECLDFLDVVAVIGLHTPAFRHCALSE